MPQYQEISCPMPGTVDAVRIPEETLLSPEPTTDELNMRRAKLASDIEAALRRHSPLPRRFADD